MDVPLILIVAGFADQPPAAVRLRVEYLDNPISIDCPAPRFSWALEHPSRGKFQHSYRIVVERMAVTAPAEMVWDSGHVLSNRTLNIPYNGKALSDDTDYIWRISWSDSEAGVDSVPASASFSTAIIDDRADAPGWYGARWVSSPGNGSLSTYRTEFYLATTPIRARMYFVGLGRSCLSRSNPTTMLSQSLHYA